MHIQNLEATLHKNMVLVFRKQGLSAQDADTKAMANLAAADALFHEKLDAGRPDKIRDAIAGMQYAMQKVVAWAHSLP